ncbi:MAG: outer membrane beta-barrel protein [Bacteroidia bacterium]
MKSDTDLVFNRSRMISELDSLLHPELQIGGYISSYFSTNDDDNLPGGFVQFPTLEPRKDQFSLNMALISMSYKSQNIRGNIILHYGDVPESSWPRTFNLIQEANGGFKIFKKLWFDAGFFKTHIGIESFQPRENIASSMSIMNFYDPYFLSGVKLTYLASSKLTLQVNAFNGYNEYLDNNKNKAFGFTAIYNANKNLSLTYNLLTCDESPDSSVIKHQRYCNNFYSTYHSNKFTIGVDVNFGIQQHSLKMDSSQTGYMYGALLVAKYQLIKQLSIYARLERFSDPNQILSGTLDIGEYIDGTTLGIEFTPYKTVSFNAEWRVLESDKLIFKQGNKMTNQRNEFNLCLDLWF